MRCFVTARFTMEAELLRWQGITAPEPSDVSRSPWGTYQDPITFEIRNRWLPVDSGNSDDTTTTDYDESLLTFPCIARGVVSASVRRGAGTTEIFGTDYMNIEYVTLWVPTTINISKRDRITNIRETRGGKILWKNFEAATNPNLAPPTIFNVNGVTPMLDGFNRHIQNFVILERADSTDG